MSALKKDELEKVLEIMFNQLQQKRLLPDGVQNKDELIQKVADKLENTSIDKEDLHKTEIKNALSVALMSEIVADKNKELELDYTILFKNFRDTPKEEVKEEFKHELKKFLMTYNKQFLDDKLSEKEIDKAVDKITDNLSKTENEDSKCLAESPQATDLLAETLSAGLRNLFGGIDPRFPGSQMSNVTSIVGNMAAIPDQHGANATSNAFIDEQNRFDGKADSLGIENSVRNRLDALSDTIEENLSEEGIYSTAPRLTMPGTKQKSH